MPNKQAEQWKLKGNEQFKAGNHAKAIEFYTYATELDPKNHIFFTNRATAYFTMGVFAKSLRDSEKAIKLNNDWFKGHLKKVECLIKLDRFQEAVDAAQLGENLFPNEAKFPRYKQQAKQAMRGSMSPAEWTKNEGNAAFKKGDIDVAIKLYTDALRQVDTKTPEGAKLAADIYANRGACNRQLYMHDDVIRDCTAAIELVPTHVKAYIRRAQSYESIEAYKKALSDFEFATRNKGGTVAQIGAARVRRGLAAHEKANRG